MSRPGSNGPAPGPRPAPPPNPPSPSMVGSSDVARRYVADFFARGIRRHDFAAYITKELAADFACALAQYLEAAGRQMAAAEAQGGSMREALILAVRQNSHDMVMTGEEIRQCEAALSAAQGTVADWSKRGSQPTDWRNELLTLSEHHGPIPAFARSAMRVIAKSMPDSPPPLGEAQGDRTQLVALIVRNCCESEPSHPDNPDTVCINVNDLEAIVSAQLESVVMEDDPISALAARQPGAQKPVAEVVQNRAGQVTIVFADGKTVIDHVGAKFYAAPPAQGIDLGPRPMDSAPCDGTMVRLLVQFTDNATEDTDGAAWTIGANNHDHDGEDVWKFAGWCWTHDHFTEGKGTPVGWLPLIDDQRDAAPGVGS